MAIQVRRWGLDAVEEGRIAFSVSVAWMGDRLVFCRHSLRHTWECPGGHVEPGETPLEAAERELYEETGAVRARVEPVCIYSVEAEDRPRSYGLLCRAEIMEMGELPKDSEIAERRLFSEPPGSWTYPEIIPVLLQYARGTVLI